MKLSVTSVSLPPSEEAVPQPAVSAAATTSSVARPLQDRLMGAG
jgi:hypothetical protein